ncbi:LacI family DNA-binding transcriptional regulator [Streptobacillus canis]|uniref:LacI family DNA-binding transcriptional regulator n=1 Tax=Streptobacillus canis TaxID=2678686 RepID=UPI0012E1FD6F|nr:LacI family DNA-binding transcriptional regulator [Streptobacillus canis]
MKKITIKDVAKKANVSEATVSRVMSNSSLISDKTKRKVLKVIKELDYFPNSAAVSLTKSSSRIIGVVIEDQNDNPLQNDFFTETLSYISTCALERGYYILYIHSKDNQESHENIERLIKTNRIDGLVFLNLVENDRNIKYLQEIDFPYVVLGTPKELDKGMWVDNDNIKATREVTKKLVEKGFKHFAFLSGPTNLTVSNYRKEGFLRAMKEAKMKSEYQISSDFDSYEAYAVTKKLLKKDKNIDAVVTTDDILAIGAIRAIEELDRKVEVTGFNNSKLRKYLKLDFITVDIRYEELANKSVNILIDSIENVKREKNFVIVQADIIEGETNGTKL